MADIRGGQGRTIGEADSGDHLSIDFNICMNKIIETYLEQIQVFLFKLMNEGL